MKRFKKLAQVLAVLLAFGLVGCSSDDDETTKQGSGSGGGTTATYYTVTFNSNGGSSVESQKVESGKKATKPVNPTKEATSTKTFSFADWYVASDFSGTAFSFDTAITKDTTLYAKWTENAISATYTVKHLQQNVSGDAYTEVTADQETKNGSVGEQTAASAKTYTGFTAQSVTQKTIVASGTVVEIKYDRNTHTVTYEDGVEGSSIAVPSDTTRYRYGAQVTVIFTEIGERSGFAFAGWKNGDVTYTSDGTNSLTMGDENVTLTAQWNENAPAYIGSKAPTAAKAVGDIVFNDGSATPYSSELTLTDAQKNAVVAVIFYAGESTDVLGAKTLGVGIHNTQGETTKTYMWAQSNTTGFTTKFTEIQCTPNGSTADDATFSGDIDGSDNWSKVCTTDTTAAANAEANYPAFNWVNNYATTYNLAGDYASGWYLPTVAELSMMYRTKATVNAAIEKADGTKIADDMYWSSSQGSSTFYGAWYVWFGDGYLSRYNKDDDISVCGVRAF